MFHNLSHSPSSSKGNGTELHKPLWQHKRRFFVVQNNVYHPPRLQSLQYTNISNTILQVLIYDILVSLYAYKSQLNVIDR